VSLFSLFLCGPSTVFLRVHSRPSSPLVQPCILTWQPIYTHQCVSIAFPPIRLFSGLRSTSLGRAISGCACLVFQRRHPWCTLCSLCSHSVSLVSFACSFCWLWHVSVLCGVPAHSLTMFLFLARHPLTLCPPTVYLPIGLADAVPRCHPGSLHVP